jgi:hypothetical protein
MTRRQLAKRLSQSLTNRGNHFEHGSTVYKTLDGEWGAFAGLAKPPDDTVWYENIGWDVIAERNTVLKVETHLRNLEKKFEGTSKRVDRSSIASR